MVKDKRKKDMELYMHVLPALQSKRKELKLKKLGFITEMDIWEYLKRTKWNKEKDLVLFDIVSDIFNADELDLVEYINREIR